MKLEQIKVADAYQSDTNPRGTDFSGPAFDDLVASVKEKGVLVPIIVRPKKKGAKLYEVIAGNRRFKAAQTVGLQEIPARIEELNDDEASEVQIIENLQREDVHPIEEGESYRRLVEQSHYEVASIAAKVGKSESYVRQRLFLTNLNKKAAEQYRKGKFTDGHAVLIAKLSQGDQDKVLNHFGAEWPAWSVSEVKNWIKQNIYDSLDYQPWLKDEEVMEAVGPCQECPPNNATLFGERKEGACTSLKCWNRKMKLYINYVAEKENTLLKVSKEYGTPETKGVIGRSDYQALSTKKKTHCEYAEKAVVAEGPDQGTVIWVCADKRCKEHGDQHTSYKLSSEEKEARKKERAREEAKKAKDDQKLLGVLAGIQWPMDDKTLDVLVDVTIERSGRDVARIIAKRHQWEVKRTDNRVDYDLTVRERMAVMTSQEKVQYLTEMLLQCVWEEPRKKALNTLVK
jgi:ParB/RepB/Spo0J family partition protein